MRTPVSTSVTAALVALSLSLAACAGEPPPPAKPPQPVWYPPPQPGLVAPPVMTAAPAPPAVSPPPVKPAEAQEAGTVKLSYALLVGGEGLSEEAIRIASKDFQDSFEAGESNFRRCYGAFKDQLPQPELQVWIDVTVKTDGSVEEVKPEKEGQTIPPMMACVLAAFSRLSYRPHPGEIFAVTAPVTFKP